MDLPKIDKESALPLYLQIQKSILEAIQQSQLSPNQRIPSASELSVRLGVSRMTVRQALQELVRIGRLYTVPGKGTFVTLEKKMEPNLDSLYGFTDESADQGFTPSSQLLSFRTIPASGKLAKHFGVSMGTPVICLSRVRLVNGQPLGIENSHLLESEFSGLEAYDWNNTSLYSVLRQRYHADLDHAVHYVEAATADREIARQLGITRGAAVMVVERHTFTSRNRPIEFVASVYRADCVRFKVEAVARNPMAIYPPAAPASQPSQYGEEGKR